jgi:hypothetical protein
MQAHHDICIHWSATGVSIRACLNIVLQLQMANAKEQCVIFF